MEESKIRRMTELYEKEIDDLWYDTNFMTEEEKKEYRQLLREFQIEKFGFYRE